MGIIYPNSLKSATKGYINSEGIHSKRRLGEGLLLGLSYTIFPSMQASTSRNVLRSFKAMPLASCLRAIPLVFLIKHQQRESFGSGFPNALHSPR